MVHRIRPTVALVALCVLLFTGFRVWLALERRTDLADLSAGGLAEMFWRGLRLDLVVVCALAAPLALLLAITPRRLARGAARFTTLWAAFALLLVAAAETAGLWFFRYYDFRPNHLVLDHAASPEIGRTVLRHYPVGGIAALAVALAVLGFLAFRRLAGAPTAPSDSPRFAARVTAFALLPLLFLGMRGTLDHRPLNPTFAAFGHHRLANEIAGNGMLSLAHEAVQRWKGTYVRAGDVLDLLPEAEAIARSRALVAREGAFTDDCANPLVRTVGEPSRRGPTNVCVVVLESYTARLVGHLGGELPLTPHLDALAAESLVLENCYATGERTIQGLEAVLCSFPPLPGVGAVRRPEARGGFFTLASALKPRGHEARFLYGGQGIFDLMSAFFLANDYDSFLEEEDFDDVTFRGAWGVCDEDVYRRAEREMVALHAAGRPFLVTVLTVSLHSPWEYPEGVIEPLPEDVAVPDGFEYEELNTFRYADAAIGRFMARAKAAPYYDDTLFVFVGDHGVHLRGRGLVPADEYRVAALFHAPRHLAPGRVPGVTSQLDVAPTILGILGGTFRTTFFGRDLTRRPADEPGRALLVYDKKRYAWLEGTRGVVLSEHGNRFALAQQPAESRWELADPHPWHADRAATATAVLQTAEMLLEHGAYHTCSGDRTGH